MLKNFLILMLVMMVSACAYTSEPKKVMTDEVFISIAKVEEAAVPVIPARATLIHINESILFDFDKAVIRDDQAEKIDTVADLLFEYPDTVLALDGYASSEGPEDYNLELSRARADAVANALTDRGVDADRIVNVVGVGATDEFGEKKLNRRVIVLSVN